MPRMTRSLREAVDAHGPGDLAPRAVEGLLAVLPFSPPLAHRGGFDAQAASAQVAARAEAMAAEPAIQAALATFDLLDKADRTVALFSGVRAGVQLARGKDDALELDPQQALDAAVKLLGIAYAASKLHGGDPRGILRSDPGKALLAWYVAADVVLPFADNVAQVGIDAVVGAIESQLAAAEPKLAPAAGDEAGSARKLLAEIREAVGSMAGQAATYANPLAQWLSERAPTLLGAADKVTGVAATAADALDAYRYIGSVYVAEVVLARAREAVEKEERDLAAAAAEEAASARDRSKQQASYALGEAVPAASARLEPIKTTRGMDVAEAEPRGLAKLGCGGCGSAVAMIAIASAGAIAAWAMQA
jgi:hypothetical protein